MSLDDLLKSLQQEYLSELPDRINGIKSHLESKDATSLVEDFHKLKGTGKTYGIPEISELGEKMEHLLLSSPDKGLMQVSHAIDLLVEIHHTRTAGDSFEISLDSRFQDLKKVA